MKAKIDMHSRFAQVMTAFAAISERKATVHY